MKEKYEITRILTLPVLLAAVSCSLLKTGPYNSAIESFIPAETTIAIQNVSIIPIEREGIITDRTVILSGGKIQSISASDETEIPDSAATIDGSGKYLLPGLLDMHVHLHPEDLGDYLSHGITTVRNMWGTPDVREINLQIKGGTVIGPDIYSASPGIDGTPPTWEYTQIIEEPDEAQALVRHLQDEGWRFLKVYNRLKPEVYRAVAQAAKAEHIRFLGHAPLAISIEKVLNAGQASVEHFTGYDRYLGGAQGFHAWVSIDETEIPGIAEKTAGTGTWNCPTLVVLDALTERNLGSSSRRQAEENRFKLLGALYGHQAKLLIGTDAGVQLVSAGSSLHEEMAKFARAGIPPFEVLRMATLEGARFLESEDEIGTVSTGKQADLVLLDANPLEDIENISAIDGIFLNGAWYSQSYFEK